MGIPRNMIDKRMNVKLEKDIKNANTQWMKHSSKNWESKLNIGTQRLKIGMITKFEDSGPDSKE